MDDTVALLFSIFIAILLVLANGFFVAVEFALVRTHPTKLRSPELKNRLGSNSALHLLETLDLNLSATQVGITIASLLLGWWGETAFHHLILRMFALASLEISAFASHALATALALSVVTFLHVVFGEMVFKSLAIRYPETTLRYLAAPMLLFTCLLKPLIRLLNGSANLCLHLFGVDVPAEAERTHSLSELAMIVSHSTERGVIDKTEEEMLHGVFNFSETIAREIMTPRTDLVTMPVDASLEEVVEIGVSSGLSRFPVVGETVDDVLGLLLIRDILPYLPLRGNLNSRDFSVRRIMREPFFVPDTKPIDDLLNEFKRRKVHIAVVLDEHGGVDGVVTLEDVIEEIVGEIFDESDETGRHIAPQENGDVLVDGGVLVADINERLEFEVPEGDYDTIAGFIYTSLGRLPRPGDEIQILSNSLLAINGVIPDRDHMSEADAESNGNGSDSENPAPIVEIVVERIQGRRIESVRLRRVLPSQIAESETLTASSQAKG